MMKISKLLFFMMIFIHGMNIHANNSSQLSAHQGARYSSPIQFMIDYPLVVGAVAVGGYFLVDAVYASVHKKYAHQKIQLFMYNDCKFCTRVISFLQQHNLLDQVELIDASVLENKNLLRSMSGTTQVPYLVDIDAGVAMLESADIIAYFAQKFDIKTAELSCMSVQPVEVNGLKKYNSLTFLSDVQKSEKPVLVLVATTWCPPCKQFKPIFQAVAEQMHESCEFIMLDGDLNEDIVALLKVRSYPTLICYKKGQRINPTNYRTKTGLMELVSQLLQD